MWQFPRGCPEQGEIQVLFSSWNCLGKAEPPSTPENASCQHPRKCLLPAPQFLHPCREKSFQHKNKRGVLPTEMSSGTHVQPKFNCGHSNLTAQLEQKEAEQDLVPKIAPIKGSCQATGNVKQCPALFPRFVECFFNRDAESSDSSKFLELRLLPANSPVTLSTLAANKPRCLQVEVPERGGDPRSLQASGLSSPNPPRRQAGSKGSSAM